MMKFGQMTSARFLRGLSFLLVMVCLLAACLCVPVAAQSSFEQGVQWKLTEDQLFLQGDEEIYRRLDLPENCQWFSLCDRYVYYNDVAAADGERYDAISYKKHGYIMVLRSYYASSASADMIYGRSDMLDEIQRYLDGQSGHYVLRTPIGDVNELDYDDKFAEVHESVATEIMAQAKQGKGTMYDVTVLADCGISELRYQDGTNMLTTLKGMIFTLPDGSLGYVHYDHLENHHFDADGNFSYRKGKVEVHLLDEDTTDIVLGTKKHRYEINPSFQYESNEFDWEYEGMGDSFFDDIKISFWILFVLVGFLLPVAPLVIGLIFAHAKKRMGHPKRWYLVVGFAALWLLISALLLLLLLV